jgi:AraC-like DNA-binding protein
MKETVVRTLRRPSAGVEVQAGVAPAGRGQHVADGRDLLLLLDNPTARVRCRRRVDPLPPALLVLVEPGEVLGVLLSTATPYRELRLAPGTLASAAAHRSWVRGRASRSVACLAAGCGLCEAADAVDGEEAACRLAERALGLCGCTVRVPAHEQLEHAVVGHVRDFLREHYRRRVPLAELAALAGMCRFALVRAFTKEVGMPPHAYQTRLRVLAARERVAAGDALSGVAVEMGFTDQSHLNRHFKPLVGVTPGEYARIVAVTGARAQRHAA